MWCILCRTALRHKVAGWESYWEGFWVFCGQVAMLAMKPVGYDGFDKKIWWDLLENWPDIEVVTSCFEVILLGMLPGFHLRFQGVQPLYVYISRNVMLSEMSSQFLMIMAWKWTERLKFGFGHTNQPTIIFLSHGRSGILSTVARPKTRFLAIWWWELADGYWKMIPGVSFEVCLAERGTYPPWVSNHL